MNWDGAAGFFAMGGHGLYVWGSYAVTALLMVAEPLLAWRRHAQARRTVALNEPDHSEEE
jgi:heme exporter protein D